MPAFFGLFIDSLAEEVEKLILFAHTGNNDEQPEYLLKSNNIEVASVGVKKPAYSRHFFPGFFLKNVKSKIAQCDYLLIRCPSPLASAFHLYRSNRFIIYLIVGSYQEGLKHTTQPWYKSWAIKKLNQMMHLKLTKAIEGARVLVNSSVLLDEYAPIARSIELIYTTTIGKSDLYIREDACSAPIIRLLFVGRIDLAKGLRECVRACAFLNERGVNAFLDIVGGEDKEERITSLIKLLAEEHNIGNKITFFGQKKAGEELLEFYRTRDVFLLPSYHEGFPRTIWEALASGIPVVATRVGSIPFFMEHGKNAYLVNKGDQEELNNAVLKVINDGELRKRLVTNGYERVDQIRLDIQGKKILDFITS